ncbi:MAG TPA: MFS transporter [Spirochaetia bacterium]|nr:MFS transporter [Spirochaetia bacterium]
MQTGRAAVDAPTRGQKLSRTFSYYALFMCLGLDTGVVGPIIPALAGQTGVAVQSVGILFFLGAGGATVGTILSGRLFKRSRGHLIMGLSQIGAGLIVAMVPFSPWFWLVCALNFAKGALCGVISAGANTLLLWTHGKKASPFLNGLHFSFGFGAFLAPLVAAQVVAQQGGYRWALWILAAFMCLAGLRVLFLQGQPSADATAPGAPQKGSAHQNDAALPVRAVLVSAALFLFFYVSAEISFGGWVFTYAITTHLASETAAAYLNSGFWLFFTLGRLVSVLVAIRLRPQRVIPASIAGSLLAIALLILARSSPDLFWVASLSLGFFMAPLWPSGFALAGNMVNLSARRSSAVLIGDTAGGMILPSLIGVVIRAAGAPAMIWLVGASMVLTAVSFLGMRLAGRHFRLTETAP